MEIYITYFFLIAATIGLNHLGQRFFKQRWNLGLSYGIPILAIMAFIWNVSRPLEVLSDFNKSYYLSGRLILENPLQLYQKGAQGFVNIPIIALLFTPISYLNLPTAQFIFTALGIIAVLTVFSLLLKFTNVRGWQRIALIGIFVINGPLYYSLRQGNSTHFVLLLLMAAILSIAAKQDFRVGVLLAITALIKLPLLLFGIYLVLTRKWQALAGFCGTIITISGASILLFGMNLHRLWYQQCVHPFSSKPLSAYNVQSLDSFLIRLLTNAQLTNFEPIDVNFQYRLIKYVLITLLLSGTIWIFLRSNRPNTFEEEYLEFSIFLCLALSTSPLSWTHYYLLLLLPLALYLGNKLAVPPGKLWFSLVTTSTLLISPPIIWQEPTTRIARLVVTKLLISHYFLGSMLLLFTLLAARWYIAKPSIKYNVNIDT